MSSRSKTRLRRTCLALEALESRQLLSGYSPTASEQLFLEELNDARANPAAYGASIGFDLSSVAPSQPLAFNPDMIEASRLHSQDMNANGYFAHVSPSAGDVGQRLSAAGVNWNSYGESIAAGQTFATPADALKGLIIDAGVPDAGHRDQLLAIDQIYKTMGQVGIGIVQGGSGPLSNYYTVDSATTMDNRPFITGVVYNDANHNGKYDIGEGIGNVSVTVSGVATAPTWSSGGYSFQVNPGTYTVTISGGGLSGSISQTVSVGSTNVRANFTTNGSTGGGGGSAPTVTAPPGPGYFAVTHDHGLYEYKDNYGWTCVGAPGSIQSASTVTDAAGHTVVFAVTTVKGLYRYDDWTGWQKLGDAGTIRSVVAGTDLYGQANVFAITADGSFFEHNQQWGWFRLGAPGTIAAMSAGVGDRVFVIGADHSVLQHDLQTGWSRLTGAGFAQSIDVTTEASGAQVVYAVTQDHSLFSHRDQTGWTRLGNPSTVQSVQAGVDASGAAHAAVISSNGTVYELSQSGWSQIDSPGTVRSVVDSAPGLFYAVMPDNSLFRHDDHWGWIRLTGGGFSV